MLCPDCGIQFDGNEVTCPYCRAPLVSRRDPRAWLFPPVAKVGSPLIRRSVGAARTGLTIVQVVLSLVIVGGLVVFVGAVIVAFLFGDNGDGTRCVEYEYSEYGRTCVEYVDLSDTYYDDDPPVVYSGDLDCRDFATQREAQFAFIGAGGPTYDPHLLDEDGDGVACEWLP
jgi:hypothetical protein